MTVTVPTVTVEKLDELSPGDLSDICDASVAAIEAGGGFGWLTPPPDHILEAYWQGIALVNNLELFVARLDGVICGAAQLKRPARNAEARALVARLTAQFVAPWARRGGAGRKLVQAVEEAARNHGFAILQLDVRETQEDAIRLYRGLNYARWGIDPHYARIDGKWVEGYYYTKKLRELEE